MIPDINMGETRPFVDKKSLDFAQSNRPDAAGAGFQRIAELGVDVDTLGIGHYSLWVPVIMTSAGK